MRFTAGTRKSRATRRITSAGSCEWSLGKSTRKDLVSFAIVEEIETPAPVVRTALLASLIKFERFEWMLEKATELGVERVVPVESERSEKGLAAAAQKRMARWNRIAREASEQSRRTRLPLIEPAVNLAE